MAEIHPSAIIHPSARLGSGSSVGAYSVIGAGVIIGKANRIASHVVIEGNTKIGDENQIYQFASIGAQPQDLKYSGEDSSLVIGNQNVIREYVTMQPGTKGGGMITKIGDQNLLMAGAHVGHDCYIGNKNILANSVALSGHVEVCNFVTIGGLSGIHQFVRLGNYCFIGGGSMVAKDIPPYCMAQGDRAGLVGLNKIGLERNGFSKEDVLRLKSLYREIFRGQGAFQDRLLQCRADLNREDPNRFEAGLNLIEFISTAKRGVAFPRTKKQDDNGD